jgi:hypothetical protein
MINWDGIRYHFDMYKVRYFIAGLMAVCLTVGVILAAVGSHTLNTMMCAIGILLSIVSGVSLIIYVCKSCCCPNSNACCEDDGWRTYGEV